MTETRILATNQEQYTLEERFGMSELNPEVAKYTFANDTETLGRLGFNTTGIENAFRGLISVNHVSNPEKFTTPRGNEPCQWQPRNIGNERREEEEFQMRLHDKIAVCFLNYGTGMVNSNRNQGKPFFDFANVVDSKPGKDKEPWYMLMQERFLPLVKNAVSGGSIRYDFGTGENSNKIITEFKKENGRNKIWQIWIPFFDNALTGYSCFVNGNIGIDSWNYQGHPTYERYGHTSFGVWKGKVVDFLKQTRVIENALRTLNVNASIGATGEVKLIHGDLGMIAMRSEGKRYEAFHPDFYLKSQNRYVNAPKTMIFGKYAFSKLVSDFER